MLNDIVRERLFSNQVSLEYSKLSLGNCDKRRSESYIRLSRNNLSLTGHYSLRLHLRRMGFISSPTYRFCNDGNESHILNASYEETSGSYGGRTKAPLHHNNNNNNNIEFNLLLYNPQLFVELYGILV